MQIYILVILFLSLANAIAKTTGWRPQYSNKIYIGDIVLYLVAIVWAIIIWY